MVKKDFPYHLLGMQSLTRNEIDLILKRANDFLRNIKENRVFDTLKGEVVANLFFETSTRTRNSFEIAAKRLEAIVLSPDLKVSALNKGESLLDMARNLQAMGTRFFVIRHTENNRPRMLAEHLEQGIVINAGDGNHQHPTQGLIDLMTIQQHKPDWTKLCVTIIGDIYHSRVANSLVDGLLIMGVPEIRITGPSQLLPETVKNPRIKKIPELEASLINSDVVVTLRLQKERHSNLTELNTFRQLFSLSAEKFALAKPDAIVMHPGPINREIEMTSEVADGKQSVILQQVQNGVAIRMAVLELLFLAAQDPNLIHHQ
ncbi:aspartate carbamoyltransferase catalytic subunit [Candidatus Coxiella mudrowiae]|uniref:Aspartate carbamoyltransferase n=1 Tax=Candidatus Coxiella mudrowiae TaxID=2054173 RepID=A0ABN4HUC1_9COXI|nr:aspartate carbamoyltransferase catalytic subunit [Candidatus Coxiella mudrowiae]AKQ34041.1 Aspartate carbamoyltransferase [Candidatus Coxiella mudrowiae]